MLKPKQYIIVTDTLCGPSYEWTTDENGRETICTYSSVASAEAELLDFLNVTNGDGRAPEYFHSKEEYSIAEYLGTETEIGRGHI